jgi:hypothetical protein
MSLQKRYIYNRKYYYTHFWAGGRVFNVYAGGGREAIDMAALAAADRERERAWAAYTRKDRRAAYMREWRARRKALAAQRGSTVGELPRS